MRGIGTEPGQWGPFVSTPPLTEYRGNVVSLWLDRTPVGFTAQFAVGRRSVVVGWIFKVPRSISEWNYGWAALKQPRE